VVAIHENVLIQPLQLERNKILSNYNRNSQNGAGQFNYFLITQKAHI
jgi:hypothetical protein